MAVPLVVPDASVILKWVDPSPDESDVARAIALRDATVRSEIDARVPTLAIFLPPGDRSGMTFSCNLSISTRPVLPAPFGPDMRHHPLRPADTEADTVADS